ncbi:MAG TPA: hypothetical protein VJ971_05130 [Methylomirabilota bacterium]|nr:hypothetical protein [Methylomirabilota bacterium]
MSIVPMVLVLGLLVLAAAAPSAAQGLPGGRRPDAIDQARGLATQPFQTPAGPDRPTERWVSPRRVYSPEQGRDVLVPGHYERDVNGQRVERPPLVTTTPEGGSPTILPGGERAPVEQRGGP